MKTTLTEHDTQFWQTIAAASTYERNPENGHQYGYPAQFHDGRQLLLPIRPRDQGRSALASLIINQASFAVVDSLAEDLAEQLAVHQVQLIIGVPTLGLTLAEATARKLGHPRYLPLGTSKKFWYDDKLSVPLSSITSPAEKKCLYIDPGLVELMKNRRVALIDDVVSTGSSISAALSLMNLCHIKPVCIGCAMLQTRQWMSTLAEEHPGLEHAPVASIHSPKLLPNGAGGWVADL